MVRGLCGGVMKGRTPTTDERRHMDAVAQLGCIACRKDGLFNCYVSLHHVDGRTKPGAHFKVLPLCAGHHQDGTGAPGLIAVHPWKTRFEQRYGRQADLLREVQEMIQYEASPPTQSSADNSLLSVASVGETILEGYR